MSKILPRHIAIIMDGNGRWALERGLLREEGHRTGVESIKTVIRCCLEKNIPILSLFAFSSENWLRPKNEVLFLMGLFAQSLEREVEQLNQHGICLKFIGEKNSLSPSLCQSMLAAEQLTAHNNKLILNILLNYGGKWDILEAVKKIIVLAQEEKLQLQDVDETFFATFLSTASLPDPDLFIRTSGEQRISNFFLWQLAYSELYFADVSWPDFNETEFEKALTSFSSRERRYGKISKQNFQEALAACLDKD